MKLDATKGVWEQEFGWVGHPDSSNPKNKDLIARRFEIDIIGGIKDAELSYEYDEWALCKLDNDFYLLSTSGCSCPSPSETWSIQKGPCTLEEIKKFVSDGEYDGYSLPGKKLEEFSELIKKAEETPSGVKSISSVIADIGNEVYKVVFERISHYETRGFNAHQRAGSIADRVKQECKDWIEKNESR